MVLADGGARALTHRAVDHGAGLPVGSTSNLFRTREALVRGVVEHLIAGELAAMPDLDQDFAEISVSAEALTQMAAAAVTFALGPGRTNTLARRALLQEATGDPELRSRIAAGAEFWWARLGQLLRAAEAPDPDQRGRWLLAYVDGVIADQLTHPSEAFDAVAAVKPAVRGILSA